MSKTSSRSKKSPNRLKRIIARPARHIKDLRSRRAHHSFRLTRRRDIPKRPKLPGLIAFSHEVTKMVWSYRKVFGKFLALYAIVSLLVIGVSQQDQYRLITEAFTDANSSGQIIDSMTQIGGIFGATLLGTLNGGLSEIQQLYLAGIYVMAWLVIIWLIRQLVAGNKVRLRDGLYNAGTPLISTICIVGLMLVQALPGAAGITVFVMATQSAIASGVIAMIFGVAALLLTTLSLYWLSGSIFALLISTLPGTYPMVAIRGAGDLAQGRRTSLLIRLIWLVLLLLIIWAILLVPALILDHYVNISWLPIVTLMIQIATGMSFIYGVSYVFLLYRRMLDEPK